MIPKSDLLFNTIISIQLDIHFCMFLVWVVFPSVCLPLHLSDSEDMPGFYRRAAATVGPVEEWPWSLATVLSSPGKASGGGSLYSSVRSDAEVLCDWINVFLPIIVYTLILIFLHLLLFCTLQV